ncbi:protein translocase subunit SecDF, partial [Peribacillus sp. SIMBA_075]
QLNLGIDFSSGTRVEVTSESSLTQEEVADFLEDSGFPSDDIVMAGEGSSIGVVRYAEEFSQQEIEELKSAAVDEYGIEP